MAVVLERSLLVTPEGVTHELRLAGLGSRFAAALVDAVLFFVFLAIVTALVGDAVGDTFGEGTLGTAFASVVVFVFLFGYFATIEYVWRGRTPGKRLNGLRVVTEDGGPIDVRQAVIRNFLRIVDFLPTIYVIGVITMLTSPRTQRLGDLASGTVVIVESTGKHRNWLRRGDKRGAPVAVALEVTVPLTDVQIAELMTWDVSSVSREETGLVLQFLERRASIDSAARARLALTLAHRLRPRVPSVPTQLGDERFLELLARAKQLRR